MAERDLIEDVRDFADEQDTVRMEPPPGSLLVEFLASAREMVMLREQKKRLTARESALKKQIMSFLDNHGDPTGESNQHRAFAFDMPIRGIARFVRQRKVTIKVDEDRAREIAERKGLLDTLYRPVLVLDQSAVMEAVEDGLLTDAELDEIFVKEITHAFVVEKERKK